MPITQYADPEGLKEGVIRLRTWEHYCPVCFSPSARIVVGRCNHCTAGALDETENRPWVKRRSK